MSEPIPESIPTSADPRFKRPTKKRALSPHSQTATHIDSLFSKIDQEITIPPSSASTGQYNVPQPPEIVQNVQGSSAGAGSGEFHVYKASRRREYERLRDMMAETKKEKEDEIWEKQKREREERDREITRKKREKRERLKKKKGKDAKNDLKTSRTDSLNEDYSKPMPGVVAEGDKLNSASQPHQEFGMCYKNHVSYNVVN
ncbi:putative duf1168 domain protein [Erysiphe necator]|uniref:Putative duf1168 domain protein n=1 Tax=Uncinula necator TaxID=52586 RepID=A0A0B1P8J3_UNCNE|nr:putative duf1168 domain protein [Erysiphe necator]